MTAVCSPSQPACPRQEAQGPRSHPFPPEEPGGRSRWGGGWRRTRAVSTSSSSTALSRTGQGRGLGGTRGVRRPGPRALPRWRVCWGWGALPHSFPLSSPTGRARHRLRCGPPAGALRPGLRGPSTEPGVPTWLRGGRSGGGRGEGLQEAQARVTQPPCPVTLGALPHFALINSKQLEDYTLR